MMNGYKQEMSFFGSCDVFNVIYAHAARVSPLKVKNFKSKKPDVLGRRGFYESEPYSGRSTPLHN